MLCVGCNSRMPQNLPTLGAVSHRSPSGRSTSLWQRMTTGAVLEISVVGAAHAEDDSISLRLRRLVMGPLGGTSMSKQLAMHSKNASSRAVDGSPASPAQVSLLNAYTNGK